MLFNSIEFLIFFPIVLIIYYIVPAKLKNLWLLLASYYFYMSWNAKYAILILISTVITYLSGLFLEKVSRKKLVVALSFISNLGILFYFKYTNFALYTLQGALSKINIELNVPTFDILLPVGISFYTFQALSYTMDVYRGEIYAEKNFLRYALFVSFFPQLVAGPIERSKNLLKQLAVPQPFSPKRFQEGFLLMLWGYFLKLVLADRIALFVDSVYREYDTHPGWYIVLASVLFAFQIYCDFAGYSTIAMGAAWILGIKLMENFNAPYLNTTVASFWRDWHISLTTWFKDYLYIPLGGSRKGKLRKYINEMIVFLVSGLWHGASISFVIWGGLNGLYQVIGEFLNPIRKKISNFLNINKASAGYKFVSAFITFILVDFAWIFFRAQSAPVAFGVIKQMFSINNIWVLFDGSLYECGLDMKNFKLMLAALLILLAADVAKKKGIVIRDIIIRQDAWFRYLFIPVSIALILIFGKYGPAYDSAAFIYFQF